MLTRRPVTEDKVYAQALNGHVFNETPSTEPAPTDAATGSKTESMALPYAVIIITMVVLLGSLAVVAARSHGGIASSASAAEKSESAAMKNYDTDILQLREQVKTLTETDKGIRESIDTAQDAVRKVEGDAAQIRAEHKTLTEKVAAVKEGYGRYREDTLAEQKKTSGELEALGQTVKKIEQARLAEALEPERPSLSSADEVADKVMAVVIPAVEERVEATMKTALIERDRRIEAVEGRLAGLEDLRGDIKGLHDLLVKKLEPVTTRAPATERPLVSDASPPKAKKPANRRQFIGSPVTRPIR